MNKSVLLASCAVTAILGAHTASATDWTGIYVGVNAGGVFGDVDLTGVSEATSYVNLIPGQVYSWSPDGVLGGAQVGYNYQISNWLFGVELEGHGMDFDDILAVGGDNLSIKSDWGASAAARLGFVLSAARCST